MGMQPFLGAALTSTDENYKKMDFEDIEDESFKDTRNGRLACNGSTLLYQCLGAGPKYNQHI